MMNIETIQQYTHDLNILYVEDSMTLRKLIKKKLEPIFKSVTSANDGKEALDLYEKKPEFYDIILSDLEMPVMDGQALSRSILDLNYLQKIIIMSSIEDFKKIIELINLGIYKFISKPVDNEQLYQVISDVAQQLRIEKLQEQEQKEVAEYNSVLKEREDKLLAEKAKNLKELTEFKKAIDTGAIVSKTTPNGIITYVNDGFCAVSKFSREELIGKNQNIIKSGNMDKHIYQRLWKTISSKKTYRGLLENKNKEGELYFIESFITPILDTDDEIVEYIAVSHDMTKLVQSLDDIKKAQKSKENFFTNISHEMKTPLNAILGFSSILEKRLSEDEQSHTIIKTIHESGRDLHHLIETILDLRKIQDKKLQMKNSAFNPKSLFSKCLQKYQQKALSKKQVLTILMDKELPIFLLGDGNRVAQLLSIICDNAIKFTLEKGVIEIDISYAQEFLHCKVTDNGIGINEEDQKRIFNYEQIDNNFTRSQEGAGVGLTLASGLIKLMQGDIKLTSSPKGSCFEILIPLKEHNE